MILCLDTNCVISLVENNPAAGDTIAVCDLARSECLVGPMRSGDPAILADYQRFFNSGLVQTLPLTVAAYERAARIRVSSLMKIKLPDALPLAAAAEHGCGLFLTNDAHLAICTEIAVEVLV